MVKQVDRIVVLQSNRCKSNKLGFTLLPEINLENGNVYEASTRGQNSADVGTLPLRMWPAVILLLEMLVAKALPMTVDGPSIGLLLIGFMGPAGLALGIVLHRPFRTKDSLRSAHKACWYVSIRFPAKRFGSETYAETQRALHRSGDSPLHSWSLMVW